VTTTANECSANPTAEGGTAVRFLHYFSRVHDLQENTVTFVAN
jgi:hypothetical protein